jgi:DNA (cytosine-5)-methyltransferase 1
MLVKKVKVKASILKPAAKKNNDDQLIAYKLDQAKKRGYFNSVDLFAGCGGMTLGFDRAGFRAVAAVEIDDDARASHQLNFGKRSDYAAFSDVTATSPLEAVKHLKMPSKEAVDIVIGGPPCQAFSRLGRARLWQLAGKKMAHAEDERATMYQYYLEYIHELKPIAFVMENVREIGKYCGRNIAEEIAVYGESLGYNVRYSLLNAAWFGVPQFRERAFIVGIHKSLNIIPSFPQITHHSSVPQGYSTSREGKSQLQFLAPNTHFTDHHDNRSILYPAVTLGEAFADLPPIVEHLKDKISSKKAQNPEKEFFYSEGSSKFTEIMRTWPNFENTGNSFTGHIIRKTPRDYMIFRHMPAGGMYPDAHRTAVSLFEKRARKLKLSEGSKEWKFLFKEMVPPYPIDKYPNKFRKLWKDHPSRTLPAHIGKDSYSHIHFDSAQARAISLREAARIQSFPDGFKFCGSMNSQLKQIGNAVPPLLAFAVASQLRSLILSPNNDIHRIQTALPG